ncbi:MAG: ABC transporter permease [Tannerella sp.]|jgi:ABC-2 type transport system permease protein|nr:ABC transporter permease [Tannerella sp.]
MTKYIFIKELKEAITNFKFVLLMLFSVTLIPLSLYLSYHHFQLRQQIYEMDNVNYQYISKGQIGYSTPDFVAEGYRVPLMENVLSNASVSLLPYKVTTSREGYTIENESVSDDYLTVLFGFLDIPYLVTCILSLLSLFASYNLINREVEEGTLKMILSNPVPRHQVLFAKLASHYLLFVLPVILGFCMGLLLIGTGVQTSSFIQTAGMNLLVILLFFLVFFTMGILSSVYFKQSSRAIIVLLSVWLFFALIIPKTAPIIASLTVPVMSEDNFIRERDMAIQNFSEEMKNEGKNLAGTVFPGKTVNEIVSTPRDNELRILYETEMEKLTVRLTEEKNMFIKNMEQTYLNRMEQRDRVAKYISVISPISCCNYMLNEINRAGYSQVVHFYTQADEFQKQVKREIYDNYISKNYYSAVEDGQYTQGSVVDGFRPNQVTVPQFVCQPESIRGTIYSIRIELLLLTGYLLLFFILAYFGFLKMNVY